MPGIVLGKETEAVSREKRPQPAQFGRAECAPERLAKPLVAAGRDRATRTLTQMAGAAGGGTALNC